MIQRVPLNPECPTLRDVTEYYETIHLAFVKSAETARRSLVDGTAPPDLRLLGMTPDEMDSYFDALFDEVDRQACLS